MATTTSGSSATCAPAGISAGGFWVAKDDPRAASEAVTGRCPVAEVSAAVLLSNGASRIVDRFALTDWPGLLTALASTSPADVIDRVRRAEAPPQAVRPDDATIAYCTDLEDAQPTGPNSLTALASTGSAGSRRAPLDGYFRVAAHFRIMAMRSRIWSAVAWAMAGPPHDRRSSAWMTP